MKIEIEPKEIKYKIQVKEGKFENMVGSLVRIKNHEVGVAPAIIKDVIYMTMTDLRTGVQLYKFPLSALEMALASTRELALVIYEIKINLFNEEIYEYIFKKADETLGKYKKAPSYEFVDESK